jgi:hypothetical protein
MLLNMLGTDVISDKLSVVSSAYNYWRTQIEIFVMTYCLKKYRMIYEVWYLLDGTVNTTSIHYVITAMRFLKPVQSNKLLLGFARTVALVYCSRRHS